MLGTDLFCCSKTIGTSTSSTRNILIWSSVLLHSVVSGV